MTDHRAVQVLVGDADARVREATRAAMAGDRGVDVVDEVCDDEEALAAVKRSRPDVAILDAGLPARGGVETCASIKSDGMATRVLIVSSAPDPAVLLAAVEAGADGYLDRVDGFSELASAVRRVHVGEAWIPSDMLGILLRRLIQRQREEDEVLDRFFRLSRREREIFFLLADGFDKNAIAKALVVSPNTARTHIQNVLGKLELHSRREVVEMAVEHSLFDRFCVRS